MTEHNGGLTEEKARPIGLLALFRRLEAKEKRLFFWLGVSLVIGIILMNLGGDGDAQLITDGSTDTALPEVNATAGADELEAKLNQVLAAVKGAGAVTVAVTYSESAETVYVFDQEVSGQTSTDGDSSSEKTSLAAVNDAPVAIKRLQPKVQGVTVVASGAGDPLVKERLYQAVKGLTGINANQIAIIEGEGSGDDEISMARN